MKITMKFLAIPKRMMCLQDFYGIDILTDLF